MPVRKFSAITIEGDIAYVELTQGKIAIIDTKNVPLIKNYPWYAWFNKNTNSWYAAHKTAKRFFWMHRLVLNATKGVFVDHVNHDSLDNRETNLRFCTQSQNHHNQRIRSNNSTGFKGVSFNKQRHGYMALIMVNKKRVELGVFDTAEKAHAAYCEAATRFFEDFACFG